MPQEHKTGNQQMLAQRKHALDLGKIHVKDEFADLYNLKKIPRQWQST